MCMMITDWKLQTFAPAAIIHSEDIPRQATNHRQRVRIFPCPVLCPADGQKWKGDDENDERLVLSWQVPANSEIRGALGASCQHQVLPWPAAISSCYRHPWPTDRCSRRHPATSVPATNLVPDSDLGRIRNPKHQEPNSSRPPRPGHPGALHVPLLQVLPIGLPMINDFEHCRIYGLLQVFSNWGCKPSYTEPLGNLCRNRSPRWKQDWKTQLASSTHGVGDSGAGSQDRPHRFGCFTVFHWIGLRCLRENLQEHPIFAGKNHGFRMFPVKMFP